MGSSSGKFVLSYKTEDVTFQNPVTLTTTSVTTLNFTVSITIIGKKLHFKVLWSNFLIYRHQGLFCPLHFFKTIFAEYCTLEGFLTKSGLFGYIEIR